MLFLLKRVLVFSDEPTAAEEVTFPEREEAGVKTEPQTQAVVTEIENNNLDVGDQEINYGGATHNGKGVSEELRHCKDPTMLHVGNQDAQNFTYDVGYHARAEHVDVGHYSIKLEKILLMFMSTDELLADNLKKAVQSKKHQFCVRSQGLNQFT
ncbi:unnamed protein product [Acanthoscelides obtectus]|uniref:Uncharacterized protein n=1 Tax=Acanthoscelides obtectus TaxID=200917 RepID=A0A9P0K2R1_ACAOB|nr:unnamed protein product [Acanthoscelides obtectus]CAK1648057.1 hypothetical protein AOBTE_LOCUS15524 [Acanthoscelides obtectus]